MAASKTPTGKKPRRRNRLLAGLMIFGLAFATVTTATATNWYGPTGRTGCNWGNMADNRTHTWNFYYVTSPWQNAMNYVDDYVTPNTVVTMQRVYGTTSATDQVVYDRAYTTFCGRSWYGYQNGSAVGHAQCVSTNSAAECEKHEVRFSTVYSGDYGVTAERNVALHETGHAFGLDHRPSAPSDVMYPQTGTTTTFSLHDRQHLQFLG